MHRFRDQAALELHDCRLHDFTLEVTDRVIMIHLNVGLAR